MHKLIKILCILITAYGFTQETALAPSEITALKEQVRKQAAQSKTIVNSFIQHKHIAFLTNDIKSSGTLYFKAPNTIKWSYTAPYEYSVIFKDKKLYINDAGKKSNIQLSSNKIFKRLNDLIVQSVNGHMLDDAAFKTSFYKHTTNYIVKLLPQDPVVQQLFKQVILTISGQDYQVIQVQLIEPSEDYTRIEFTNQSINQPIPDAVFVH